MNEKRIVCEKMLFGNFEIGKNTLKKFFPKQDPTIIEERAEEMAALTNGQPIIDIIDSDQHQRSMKLKIEELEYHKELTNLGLYHEPMSWNDFRQWALSNPHVFDQWYESYLGPDYRLEGGMNNE